MFQRNICENHQISILDISIWRLDYTDENIMRHKDSIRMGKVKDYYLNNVNKLKLFFHVHKNWKSIFKL